jgi:2-(1,2-epoxy-1,2-dihydrophenyl)acetyl-CoA isomerase
MTRGPVPAGMPPLEHAEVQVESGVGVVRLQRAESMNSFDPAVVSSLHGQLRRLLDDPAVRAIVLTGSGKAFCAGADVREFERGLAAGTQVQWILDATAALHPLLRELHESPKVLVAAVNGVAAGGGLGMALAADARIASPDARFAASYFRMGLSPDGGATWLLPRLVGLQRARRFFFDNEVMDAQEALRTGLVDEVVPADRLLQRATEVARAWGAWSEASRGATKRLLATTLDTPFAAQLEMERGLIASAAGTAGFAEGVRAFREKRAPRFG